MQKSAVLCLWKQCFDNVEDHGRIAVTVHPGILMGSFLLQTQQKTQQGDRFPEAWGQRQTLYQWYSDSLS